MNVERESDAQPTVGSSEHRKRRSAPKVCITVQNKHAERARNQRSIVLSAESGNGRRKFQEPFRTNAPCVRDIILLCLIGASAAAAFTILKNRSGELGKRQRGQVSGVQFV